eukprot:scaffold77420_cov63-Phaeocystis_antarctica.AAC.2
MSQGEATHQRIHGGHKTSGTRRHRHHRTLHPSCHLLPLAQRQRPPRLKLAQHRDISLLLALAQRARPVDRIPPEAQGQLHLRRRPILDFFDEDSKHPQESCECCTLMVDQTLELADERDVVDIYGRLQSQNHLRARHAHHHVREEDLPRPTRHQTRCGAYHRQIGTAFAALCVAIQREKAREIGQHDHLNHNHNHLNHQGGALAW